MTYAYTDIQKQSIKLNPINRANCVRVREITIRRYREFQAAEKSFVTETRPDKKKEAANYMQQKKDEYESTLSTLTLYKEIFPDLVK